ncbi:MAG: sigma-70 family RNA polymerase sigma factor [Planctomycetes bacterium]|nr:sigma-70 family RNA polymerase sigma factor [Planctomycetota bacterium]
MTSHSVTVALARIERGEPGASEDLWRLVYEDLKQLAAVRLARLGAGQTMQATALVHEVWVRLGGDTPQSFDGRAHFFGAAANAMRNILVDEARKKARLRRNAGRKPVTLSTDPAIDESDVQVDLLALDEALTAFAAEFERPARIVMLRYFAGVSIPQIAELLSVTSRTVDREYLFARTWLRRFLSRE